MLDEMSLLPTGEMVPYDSVRGVLAVLQKLSVAARTEMIEHAQDFGLTPLPEGELREMIAEYELGDERLSSFAVSVVLAAVKNDGQRLLFQNPLRADDPHHADIAKEFASLFNPS